MGACGQTTQPSGEARGVPTSPPESPRLDDANSSRYLCRLRAPAPCRGPGDPPRGHHRDIGAPCCSLRIPTTPLTAALSATRVPRGTHAPRVPRAGSLPPARLVSTEGFLRQEVPGGGIGPGPAARTDHLELARPALAAEQVRIPQPAGYRGGLPG